LTLLKVFVFPSIVLPLITSFALAEQSHIAGVVLDSVSLGPLGGANVILVGTTMGTTTDDEGRFSVSRLDPGTYVLRFTFVGYASVDRSVVLSAGDSVWLRILLAHEHIASQVVVVTGTRTLRSIADVPVRVEAIPEEEVEEKLLMTPSNVAMLLNESTGMRVQTTSAAANTANLRIQGLSGRYTQILNDGIPSLGGLSAGLSLTQLAPLDLRQVEVLKGATSSLYGADAIAGVVNFIPKIPGEASETSLLLNATTQRGLDAAGFYSERLDETGVSILASHNRQARYDVDGDGFADVAQFERTTATPRILHYFSDNLSARWGLSVQKENRTGGAMDETPVPGALSPPYTEKIKTTRLDVTSHINWQSASGQEFSVKLALLRSERDATFGLNPFNAVQDVYFADVQYALDLSSHNLLFGSAFRIDDFKDRTPNVPSPRSYRFSVPSIFTQDEMHVIDALTFLVGGRLDFHNVFGTFFVPRFSVMYRPFSSLTLRLGAGTGYKAPTIFVEEAEEAGFRNVRPLTNAGPEKAQSASFDLNWRSILGLLTLDCNSALFFTNLNDALVADDDSLQADVVYLRNANGSTKSIGGEFSVRLTYDDLKVSFGYTYLYATQRENSESNELELNPRHSLGLVAVWENHEQQLKVGLENYWTGRQRVQRNPFRATTPSYWITGLIAEKGFGDFRLFINLENIFDTRQTKYEPIFVGNLSAGNIRTLPVYAPLEGRVINGGIRYVMRSTL
jgi:outer membrane receptor for ferrienterochelin and colicins